MQDIEFTIQKGRLFMLQTRTGKRTAQAALKIAVDMLGEGLINEKEAVERVQPEQLEQLMHRSFDPKAPRNVIASGLPASPGAASGQVVFNADDAEEESSKGKKVILVRVETSPEDVGGMAVAEGILTAVGGMTSHAAIVARGMGKCCVVGCGALQINYPRKQMRVGKQVIKKGDPISIDGTNGQVMLGEVATVEPKLSGDFATFMGWVDKFRKIGVRANADTPEDARVARELGAEGIGLTRTEHMFFAGDRIVAMREMILAADEEGRRKAVAKLLPMQKGDFLGIFKAMAGLPVTIRFLDPPLHEFLPQDDASRKEMAESMGVSVDDIKAAVTRLHELNPMLGHRGCRVGITYPEVYDMQARAIMEAACQVQAEGMEVYPEIMIPLVGIADELRILRERTDAIAKQVIEDTGVKVNYTIGTMIEVPRAALTAEEVARYADFFSFGTNDLTQMTFGFSRDDIGSFLPDYIEKGILPKDPFQVLDQTGTGQLVEIGIKRGRTTRPDLKVGICGEHGGEPASVAFCHRVGMNYVSCSPYRVPIARLAAARAAMADESK
jgi:pyruvate,orthophosphate dikinase